MFNLICQVVIPDIGLNCSICQISVCAQWLGMGFAVCIENLVVREIEIENCSIVFPLFYFVLILRLFLCLTLVTFFDYNIVAQLILYFCVWSGVSLAFFGGVLHFIQNLNNLCLFAFSI